MRIQILSDLHLEFEYQDYNFTECDVLILAGDIHTGTSGVEWIKDKVKDLPVIYILGNHEYYNYTYPKLLLSCKKLVEGTNIHVLENESTTIEDVTFHCATLWTDFNLYKNPKIAQFECEQKMNDYRLIHLDDNFSRLRADNTLKYHINSREWLCKSLSNSTSKQNVIVTHHAPSILSVAPKFKDSLLTTGFASNLEDLIEAYQPDLWLHGHVHDAVDYYINKTRVVCNPEGYPHEIDNGFVLDKIIEI